MDETRIQEIAEKIKNTGAIGINNFLDSKKFQFVSNLLTQNKYKPLNKDDNEEYEKSFKGTGIPREENWDYAINYKNYLAKLIKLDLNEIRKSIILKKVAKDLELEKIAEAVFNQKAKLHKIDTYVSKKSNNNIVNWHCDWADGSAKLEKNININHSSIKFFIYITDVQSQNGSLGYIPNSHHVVKALCLLMIEKKIEYRTFWRLEDLRSQVVKNELKNLIIEKIGSEKLNLFIDNSKFIENNSKDTFKFDFVMNKGSVVIFDELGVHRGSMPSKTDRQVLRFLYCKKF